MDRNALEEGSVLSIDFEKRGSLVPAIVQHAGDGRVLMLAYVSQAALDRTLESGMATFWSTSRGELWTKGETSGDFLAIVEILVDCDQDALVYRVEPKGSGACHTKSLETGRARSSCFYRSIDLADRTLRKLPE
jgi:phosphoribosyl-AMP cyclohydrolase